jgi:hypothetical protein
LRQVLCCLAVANQLTKDMPMKILIAAAALALLAGPAMAQASPSSGSQHQQTNTASTRSLAAAQKIKSELQNEGFTDVKIVAESFVIQGKSPDGDPVVMTIGPHGMSVFEAMNAKGANSGSATVGSNGSSSGASNGSGSNAQTNPAQTNPKAGSQQ